MELLDWIKGNWEAIWVLRGFEIGLGFMAAYFIWFICMIPIGMFFSLAASHQQPSLSPTTPPWVQ